MIYWDSSAIVALLVNQEASPMRRALLNTDGDIATWWGSQIECASALNRLHRERHLTEDDHFRLLTKLERFATQWHQVPPVEQVRRSALRLLGVHALRAADATQLAAALIFARQDPRQVEFATDDRRLAAAARVEGFALV